MEKNIINKLGIFFIFALLMLSACSQDETSINVLNPIIENTTQSTTDNCESHVLYSQFNENNNDFIDIIIQYRIDNQNNITILEQILFDELKGLEYNVIRRYDNFPLIALEVNKESFCRIIESSVVKDISMNKDDWAT